MRKKVIFICIEFYNMRISLFDSDRAVRKMDLFSYYILWERLLSFRAKVTSLKGATKIPYL